MPRRHFTLAAAASLLLCAATCVLWVRSHWIHDSLSAGFGGPALQLTSGEGRFVLAVSSPSSPSDLRIPWSVRWSAGTPLLWNDLYGNPLYAHPLLPAIGIASVATPAAVGIHAPHWLVCLLSAVLPAAWATRRMTRPTPPGLCPACGYDLRATPDRCPECGTPAP